MPLAEVVILIILLLRIYQVLLVLLTPLKTVLTLHILIFSLQVVFLAKNDWLIRFIIGVV